MMIILILISFYAIFHAPMILGIECSSECDFWFATEQQLILYQKREFQKEKKNGEKNARMVRTERNRVPTLCSVHKM